MADTGLQTISRNDTDKLTRHEPLYLKHRPQALAELVGQTAVTQTLTNAINHNRLSHAYLFTGPRGTGKTSSARILAKSLNCKGSDASGKPIEKATAAPCQQCASCLEIKNGNSPAVMEIDAASNNSVDDARVLIERAPLVAPGGRYKIYIIDECHMLTKEAFNALLKTIEDPPPNVVFILATTEEHKVLPTIISRCQRLMFRLVTQEDLLPHLRTIANEEAIEITDRALEFIARKSGGGLRDALSLLDQSSLLAQPGKPVDIGDLLSLLGALHEDVLLEMSAHIHTRSGDQLLLSANKLLQEGREPAVVVQELARHFLNLAKASYLNDLDDPQTAAAKLIVSTPSYLQGLFEQAPKFERSELSQMVDLLDKLEQTCRRTSQPGMHLEVGLLALCHRHDMLVMRDLAERIGRLEQGAPPVSARPLAAAPAGTQARSTVSGANRQPDTEATAPATNFDNTPADEKIDRLPIEEIEDDVLDLSDTADEPAEEQTPAATAAGIAPNALPVVSLQPVAPVRPVASQAPASPVPATTPASAQAASTQATSTTAESDCPASPDEVDRVWSRMLDELQRRHLPTFSLVSMHAFPLALNAKEFSMGVATEAFQKMIEMKSEHVKNATTNVLGKPVNIKVRVSTRDLPAGKTEAKPRERATAPAASSQAKAGTDEEPDSPPRTTTAAKPSLSAQERAAARAGTAALHEPLMPPAATIDTNHTNTKPAQADVNRQNEAANSQPRDNKPISASDLLSETASSNSGAIVKEAYKLFEGPGSRRIGD